jgi:hypothetical protein
LDKSEIGMKARDYYIEQESNYKKSLIRDSSKLTRRELTDIIKDSGENDRQHGRAYSNYTKLVYKKVIGKDVKKIKEARNVKENENVRDYFTTLELDRIQDLESKIANFIEFTDTNGKSDKEIYAMVKEHIENN